MSKPVEIEFLMKDGLSGGLDKAGRSVEALLDRAKAAAELINRKIADQHKVIDGVTADLDRMERQLSGMKPGNAQMDLAADVAACRKVLDEERATLSGLEKQHREAEKAVSRLANEYAGLSDSEERAATGQKNLAGRISDSRSLIKQTASDVKELEKAYKNAAPGKAKSDAGVELAAARKALEEEKAILASLTEEQERNRTSNKRLSMQLRELQDAMAKMRLEGRENSEEYRRMATEAANLSDTIADLRTQTQILSNDDANLQGFMSGVSGLSGVFTAATGALSLFVGENENLARIQTRVQSVMAITMGLQQVFNTLNKDSAFRLVTVTRMKNLLTAANTRLATSLGISTVAAKALMATLTFGLSAAVTGLIVLWDRYNGAQEEAARKAKELVEVESDGRAQMIKARFEIDNAISSLKDFSGSKEEEKRKTDELNRKFGEAFGYYETVAEWYDVLIRKSEDYIQMLFLQAKAQSMVNKAVELDAKVAEAEAKPESDYDTWWGYGGKIDRFFSGDSMYKQDNNGKWLKKEAVDALKKERDELLGQVNKLTVEAAGIGKASSIGGHVKPERPKDEKKERDRELEAERQRARELQQLRWKNEQEAIDQMEEGSERRIRQINLDYEKEMAEIEAQKKKWKEAQNGILSQGQSDGLGKARELAAKKYADDRVAIQEEQRRAEEAAMRDYLSKYGEYEDKKRAIEEEYRIRKDKADTEGEKMSLQKQMEEALRNLDLEKLKDSLDWEQVFGDLDKVSTDTLKSLKEKLKGFMASQKDLSPENLKELAVAIEKIEGKVSERNPFESMSVSFKLLKTATDAETAAQKAYNKALEEGTEEEKKNAKATLESVKDLKQKALVEATDALHKGVDEVGKYLDAGNELIGIMDTLGVKTPEWLDGMMSGFGEVLDGLSSIDLTKPMSLITGSIKTIKGALSSLVSFGGIINWNGSNGKEVRETINRLTDRNEKLQASIEDLTGEIKSGFGTRSVASYRSAYKYQQEVNENYLKMAQAQAGYHGKHHSWGYYWDGFTKEQVAKLSEQIGRQWNGDIWNLSPEEMKKLRGNIDMWTRLQDGGKGGYGEKLAEKLDGYIEQAGKLEELTDQLYEGLTGISFDSMYGSFIDNLMDMKYDAKAAAGDISEYFTRAMLSNKIGEMYGEKLKQWWEKFGEAMEDNELTESERNALADEYMGYVDEAIKLRDKLAEATGYNPDKAGSVQSAKAGGFVAMTQDQGTKLEGMFTSGLQHWSSIDEKVENVIDKMSTAEGHLAKIEENTRTSAGHLDEIKEDVKKIIRDGLKMK